MSACDFTIQYSGDANAILSKARSAIESQNGNLSGNNSSGNFDVTIFGNTINGSYKVAGQNLNIIIDSKPFMVPCNMIESFLKSKIA